MEINISIIIGTIINFAILILGVFAAYSITKYVVMQNRESKERLKRIEEKLENID